jgi:hypothetical protein
MLKERKKVELLLTLSRRPLILTLVITIILLFSYISRLERGSDGLIPSRDTLY